jgi:hypothetical protein
MEIFIVTPKDKIYQKLVQEVLREAPNLIKKAITMNYIDIKLKQQDILLFVCIENSDLQQIRGFSIVVCDTSCYYLSVLCANHCGSFLIDKIKENAKEKENINYIYLMCNQKLFSYYSKFGFESIDNMTMILKL